MHFVECASWPFLCLRFALRVPKGHSTGLAYSLLFQLPLPSTCSLSEVHSPGSSLHRPEGEDIALPPSSPTSAHQIPLLPGSFHYHKMAARLPLDSLSLGRTNISPSLALSLASMGGFDLPPHTYDTKSVTEVMHQILSEGERVRFCCVEFALNTSSSVRQNFRQLYSGRRSQ